MTLAFTVCSNNFLAQAKTMLESLKKHNSNIKTFLFLSDKRSSQVNYEEFKPAEVIPIDEKLVPVFNELVAEYNLFELNSILKPFLFQWLISKYPDADKIYYFDSDICFYDDLGEVDKALEEHDIVITPHFWTPIPDDGLEPFENGVLNFGIYNLGFLAVNPQQENTRNFLQWWGDRVRKYGHYDIINGYFVDQIWINLVPLFFKNVLSLRHAGYNMAAWNLHERMIERVDAENRITLNTGDKLVFYHFSSYDHTRPGLISRKYNRPDFSNSPGLKKLCDDYNRQLRENGIESYSQITCALPVRKEKKPGPVKKLLSPGVKVLKQAWRKL